MARVDVIMPQMGESIAEGTLSKWLKRVGDEVKRDEAIFEISTDKVDAEIPSSVAGVLAEILVQEGQTVAVQTVVGRIETEKGAAVGAASAAPVPSAASEKPVPAAGESPARGAPPTAQGASAAASVPHHSTAAAIPTAGGNGFEDRIRTKSSPLVRKIAAEHGIELASMHGTGIAGRVTKKDIESYLASGAAPAAVARPSMHAPTGAEQHGPAPEPWPGDRVEPMSKIRVLTSDHMVAARRTAAHVTSFFEIDLTRVGRIRQRMRAQFESDTGQ